jgi:hypothetical protein
MVIQMKCLYKQFFNGGCIRAFCSVPAGPGSFDGSTSATAFAGSIWDLKLEFSAGGAKIYDLVKGAFS